MPTGSCSSLTSRHWRTRHELGEQAVVHPVTRDHTQHDGDAVATTCAAHEEHADRAIATLADLGADHPSFPTPTRFAAFHQTLLDHLAYEQRDEFPRLRRSVPTQNLHTMFFGYRQSI